MSNQYGRAYLLRHGETEWSRDGRHTGLTDLPLTERGERQARAAGPMLADRDISHVFVSPLQRARRTAELAGFSDVQVDDNLVEWDYGVTEGISTLQIREIVGYDWELWSDGVHIDLPKSAQVVDPPSPGETVDDVARRASAVVRRIEPHLRDGQDVLIVAHGHLLRVLTAMWLELAPVDGSRFVLETATVSTLAFERERHVIAGWNVRED
ncbi:probable phosphoglycerate mutase [Paraoerskovia marina]|uniref:Probable phosphoglycerate mutase n=1 Tax=Paraoerskovia marina TaxID=545619 RepID=A0A1H1PA25_9CELL|nr:histidine phosphatase family protein [Paraoerskovia marina]SDS08136.1 probable phosphoglycerate mutase [Paraoerskovia marina]